MIEELPKVYHPAEVEQKWYKYWEDNKLFPPIPQSLNPPFTVVIPPPNITGSLHMGHALNNSIQDLLIRYKRMCGFKTLWVPGTDHAGIATQNVVERELKKEGKRKEDLGREKFMERVWEWKKEYGGQITKQLRRLGASCDWSRECFTMDEKRSKAVREAFLTLYNEGLIYRGKRIINWCPRCKTALSDIEVEHETIKGKLWYIRYPHPLSLSIVVATTRPETMLGDTAVAVNPKDERYRHVWGKTVELPLVGRHIPIIKDDFVDPAFGTGAVKVTPAHDPNDYEMGMRHNLPFVNILTPDGHISFKEFMDEREKQGVAGIEDMDRFKARDEIVRRLQENGYLEKIEDYETAIGHCYRCKTIIEPYLSDQWFVKVRPLAEKAIAAVEEGKIKLVPERWTKVYLQWMTNLRDWCISRQIWWGHKIPLEGEEDVLDTWFSSALWPFSTLGWPEETEDLKTYYPTSVLVTGYDIITFWVSRMIMMGLYFKKEVPFHIVYVHGLVRDITGKKMSKSLGNVIDPVDVINHAGADALRFALISLITGQGQDIKLSEDKITEARNFANKVWNASRFVLMSIDKKIKYRIPEDLSLADKWIIGKLHYTIHYVSLNIDNYEFGQAARELYDFIWGEFCDWYLEISKIDLYSADTKRKEKALEILVYVLEGILRLLHPFMPFITEEIWQMLRGKTEGICNEESISISSWPKEDLNRWDPRIDTQIEYLKALIISTRNIKANYSIQTKEVDMVLIPSEEEKIIIEKNQDILKFLAKTSNIFIKDSIKEKPKHSVALVAFKTQGYIPLTGLIDLEKEKARMIKEKERIRNELEKIRTRLGNQKFLEKAKPEAVSNEKARERELTERERILSERIKDLSY